VKKISEEDLFGYVLGALDASEEYSISNALKQSLALRERLAEAEEKLAGLPDRFVEIDPPKSLLDKTLNTISIVDAAFEDDALNQHGRLNAGLSPDTEKNNTEKNNTNSSPSARLTPVSDVGVIKKSNWSMIDLVVSCSVCLVFAAILLPSIANSRFQSDLLYCQNNLRAIGYNLASIADSYDGKLEVVRNNDQIDVAQYVKYMIDAELASDSSGMICPSDPLKEQTQSEYEAAWFQTASHRSSGTVELVTPDMDPSNTLSDSSELEQSSSKMSSSGSYGYAVPARISNSSRLEKMAVPSSTDQVLAGDSPSINSPGFQSLNHGSKGQNVLYGDLSVAHIQDSAYLPSGDHIYLNNQGEVQPGFSLKDNLLATGTIICKSVE